MQKHLRGQKSHSYFISLLCPYKYVPLNSAKDPRVHSKLLQWVCGGAPAKFELGQL